jgi:hypothetical protein
MLKVGAPPAPGGATELGMDRGEASLERSQVRVSLADVVEQCRSDKIFSLWLPAEDMACRLQSVTLVISGLGEEGLAFLRRQPESDLIDLIRFETLSEDYGD